MLSCLLLLVGCVCVVFVLAWFGLICTLCYWFVIGLLVSLFCAVVLLVRLFCWWKSWEAGEGRIGLVKELVG